MAVDATEKLLSESDRSPQYWLLGAQFLQKPSRPAGLTQPLRMHRYCRGLPLILRVLRTDAMLVWGGAMLAEMSAMLLEMSAMLPEMSAMLPEMSAMLP